MIRDYLYLPLRLFYQWIYVPIMGVIDETKQNHAAQSGLSRLTEREREVLDLLAQGPNEQGNCRETGDHHQHRQAVPQGYLRKAGRAHAFCSHCQSYWRSPR
jgi:hypothetical protein